MGRFKSDSITIQVDSLVTLSSADAAFARECVRHTIESLTQTIDDARVWSNRNPIVREVERLREEARALLERMNA